MKPSDYIAGLLVLAWATGAYGQSAEHPTWQVGDKWSFSESASPPPAESLWTREVIESLPEGKLKVRTQNGGTLIFDEETNSLDARGPEYTWRRFSFPLFVGKKWTHRRQFGEPPHNGYEQASWEVKAYENLTVPAGTFECFRVQGMVWTARSLTLYGQTWGSQDVTYWYCPAVKWFARMKVRSSGQWSATKESDSVLTSFSGSQ